MALRCIIVCRWAAQPGPDADPKISGEVQGLGLYAELLARIHCPHATIEANRIETVAGGRESAHTLQENGLIRDRVRPELFVLCFGLGYFGADVDDLCTPIGVEHAI